MDECGFHFFESGVCVLVVWGGGKWKVGRCEKKEGRKKEKKKRKEREEKEEVGGREGREKVVV